MENYKKCKACHKEKSLNDFVKNKYAKTSGYLNVCKLCRKLKLKIDRTIKDSTSTIKTFPYKLKPTKEDYASMYELLKRVGYDVDSGDIHEQFINKWNDKLDEKMVKKERHKNSLNHYLPNGDKNPDAKKSHNE
jgi:hypothetical protein